MRIIKWLVLCLLLAGSAAYAASVNLSFNITGGAAAQTPGPSLALWTAHPYYTCSINKYVYSGSTSGSGTSGSPWTLAQAVAQSPTAGTCMNLAPGTYNLAGNSFNPTHGGSNATLTGYVVWRCSSMPFGFSGGALQGEGSSSSCHFYNNTNVSTDILDIGANYMIFDGLELDGNTLGFICFAANAGTQFHHIWLLNSSMHGCSGQSGVQYNNSDWGFFIHNVWHNNAQNSFNGTDGCGCDGSGLSIYGPTPFTYTPTSGNPDYWHSNTLNHTYGLVIAYNVGFNNNDGGSADATDGEGIILDTFTANGNYTRPVLVMGNIMFSNGGSGIEPFAGSASPVDVINNTTYNNGNNGDGNHYQGNFMVAFTGTTTMYNNIAYSSASHPCPQSGGTTPSCTVLTHDNTSGNVFTSNITYPAGALFINNSAGSGGTPDVWSLSGTNKNINGTDPNLTTYNASTPNLEPKSGSITIGTGQAFDLWQQSGTVDIGACPYSSPGPVTSCP